MNAAFAVAVALAVIGTLYVHLRWRRSPRAYRAMIVLAISYLALGAVAGAWLMRLTEPKLAQSVPLGAAAPILGIPAPMVSNTEA